MPLSGRWSVAEPGLQTAVLACAPTISTTASCVPKSPPYPVLSSSGNVDLMTEFLTLPYYCSHQGQI